MHIYACIYACRSGLLAQKVRDEDMTAESEAWVLYPSTGGNVQRLAATADGPCALIQVLSPPRGSRLQHNIGYDFYKDMPCEQIHPAGKFVQFFFFPPSLY